MKSINKQQIINTVPTYKSGSGNKGITRTVGPKGSEMTYHVNPEDYEDFLKGNRNVTLPETTVTAADPKNYRSDFHPEDIGTFMNVATAGFLNRGSVSQDLHLLKDIYDASTGNKSWKDVADSAILGNSGVFKNPLANLALDIAVPAASIGIYKLASLKNAAKVPKISINTPESEKEIVNNFDSKVTNLRNLKNQSLGKSNTRVFNHNNINYTVDNGVDDITMSNYLENANGVGKHIEWYPKNYEKYAQVIRDNGFRFLDQKAYDDGVKQLAKDLASNNELLYSKDFLSKVEAAAKKEYMNSFDLLKDIQTASRMLNFKPLPARPKYEIPIKDLASENFSTLNKNVSGVYYPGKHTIYMEFNANGEPTANNALYTWIHENEHYFQELFKDEFNSKSNKVFIGRGYTSPDSYGLKFMSLVDGINYPEASQFLAEKGSTNKENLLPYYEFFIKQNKDFDYNDVNNLIDQMGDALERQRLSSTEYSPNAYDEAYVNASNNSSNYSKGVRDLTEKYKQEFGKEPYANELIDYGNKNKEFLHKYQQKVPTIPEKIDEKRVFGRLDALKFGLGIIPTAGILLNKHKDGGKMKISFGKSGIHIKKQNEGKFTEYCGGKVTQDCINKAKASGNSKLVKRAVFAENARHWKHQNGGILKKWGQSLKDTYLNIPIELAKAAYNTITHGDPNYDYKGRFNGGSFNGAGAGGSWTTTKQKQPSNFNEAFDQAVKNKQKTFTFNGLLYNTNHENNPVRETNNRIIGEIRSKSKKKDTNYTHMAGPIHVGNLDAVPIVTNKNGGILKGQTGLTIPNSPQYFKQYGIDSTKFANMWQSLVDKGIPQQAAFDTVWQSLKETPKGYYAFGVHKPNLNQWSNQAFKSLTTGLYKSARDSTNFQQYRKATYKYNPSSKYTNWLKNGRSSGVQFINNYRKANHIQGDPIVMLDSQNINNLG